MLGLKLTLPVVALIGLAACAGPTTTLSLSDASGPPPGTQQAECLDLQNKMDDPSLTVFIRNGARDDFNNRDCVYRNIEDGSGLMEAITAPVGNN